MKLPLLLIFGATAQDVTSNSTETQIVDERKKNRECQADLPKNCLECHFVRNMGDGVNKQAALDHCRSKGWDVKMSVEDLLECSDNPCQRKKPISCMECKNMGAKCIKQNGATKLCKELGLKKGKCSSGPSPVSCSSPKTCNQCSNFSSDKKCAKKQKKSCKKMNCGKG